ncbi:hypothetical protein Y958_05850 [Nitrospirillum viridazoti CBAmc]|uniref:Uncharacterized protein n=1 Tax=Nitrospirillum viridazoti CBAmc TaxID=1441467 RepID=A0A248JP52_9PROT|nr:hypothetical protein Y958_05850 [Nitrospirillum amazonense CBAmc]
MAALLKAKDGCPLSDMMPPGRPSYLACPPIPRRLWARANLLEEPARKELREMLGRYGPGHAGCAAGSLLLQGKR